MPRPWPQPCPASSTVGEGYGDAPAATGRPGPTRQATKVSVASMEAARALDTASTPGRGFRVVERTSPALDYPGFSTRAHPGSDPVKRTKWAEGVQVRGRSPLEESPLAALLLHLRPLSP